MPETNGTNYPAATGDTDGQCNAETSRGPNGIMPTIAIPPEPEMQPDITVISVPKPAGGSPPALPNPSWVHRYR